MILGYKKIMNLWLGAFAGSILVLLIMKGIRAIFGYTEILVPLFYIQCILLITSLLSLICAKIVGIFCGRYEKGGNLETWYDINRKYMCNEWIVKAVDTIINKNIIRFGDKLVFASPAANKGVYEKYLFKNLSKREIRSKFIVGDLRDINGSELSEKNQYGEYIYNKKRNGLDIEKLLIDNGEKQADIILDFKGVIWYSITPTMRKDSVKNIKFAFERFSNVLTKDGCIIIDDVNISFGKLIIYHLIEILSGVRIGLGERSTYARLMRLMNKSEELRTYMNRFDMIRLKVNNERQKPINLIVIKKVSA